MVIPVSKSGSSLVERPVSARPATVAVLQNDIPGGVGVAKGDTPAARLARLGPPIDVNRVHEIRAAISEGRYTVDADRLAAAMLALDLPLRDA